ncbi:MAG: T9SS type A sorting domain-containing protein [Bacteroidetes bacterium]|nr:T9SS type A sorting domain-containing protein [Bacteroidota bacterium]
MKKIASYILGLFVLVCILPLFTLAQPVFRGESVEYDYAGKRWFTSDNGTSIIQRDSNAVVSYFGTGLKASHGMEILGNTLFTCEGTKIYGYDLTTELEVMQVTVPGSAFLNGLTNDGVDRLYATCFSNKKIFEINVASLSFPAVTEIVSATVTTPNGIIYDSLHQRLLFTNWNTSNAPIKAVDLNGFAVTTVTTTGVGKIDGIDDDGLGHYYISSWSPIRISRYDTNFVGAAVTITAPGINNPADICYAKGIDTLGIPNGNGPVTFIGFGPVVGIDSPNEVSDALTVYPNPVSSKSVISFELRNPSATELQITDLQGRIVHSLLSENMPAGRHHVLLAGIEISAGIYLVKLQAPEAGIDVAVKFVKE